MPDWNFEIETNGTIMPSKKQLHGCQFNCSPKLENSGNMKVTRIKPEVLKALNKVDTQFKFVVMSEADVEESERDFIIPMNLDINKIVLMPQGVTAKEVADNAKIVVEIAKKKGYRLLNRLQVDIWGAKRRV
jgi:organic radical activating enzyme